MVRKRICITRQAGQARIYRSTDKTRYDKFSNMPTAGSKAKKATTAGKDRKKGPQGTPQKGRTKQTTIPQVTPPNADKTDGKCGAHGDK